MAFYIQYEFNKRQNEILQLQVKINIRQSLEPYFIYLIDSLKKFKLENNSNKKIKYEGDYIVPQNPGDPIKLKYQVSNVFIGIMNFKETFLSYNMEIDNGEDKNEIIEEFLFKYLSSLSINEIHFNLYYLFLLFHTELAQSCKNIIFKSIENLPIDNRKEFLIEVYNFKI